MEFSYGGTDQIDAMSKTKVADGSLQIQWPIKLKSKKTMQELATSSGTPGMFIAKRKARFAHNFYGAHMGAFLQHLIPSSINDDLLIAYPFEPFCYLHYLFVEDFKPTTTNENGVHEMPVLDKGDRVHTGRLDAWRVADENGDFETLVIESKPVFGLPMFCFSPADGPMSKEDVIKRFNQTMDGYIRFKTQQ